MPHSLRKHLNLDDIDLVPLRVYGDNSPLPTEYSCSTEQQMITELGRLALKQIHKRKLAVMVCRNGGIPVESIL